MSKNVVAKAIDFNNLPVPEVPQGAGAGRGNEGMGMQDIVIPRLEMIQALSPQRKKNDPAFIPGAEEGMIFNTVTKTLYGEAVYVVPVLWRKEWVLWRDRNKGGGFGGAHATHEAAEIARAEKEVPADWEAVETAQNFVLVVSPESTPDNFIVEEAVVSFSKGKMAANRQWNSLIRSAGGDRFSRMYKLHSKVAKGAKGEYFTWGVDMLGGTPLELFKRAEAAYDAIRHGMRDVARDYDDEV